MNSLIEASGFENLDFKRNLGHSMANHKDDRIYIEAGNKAKFKEVDLFTFEPHIKKENGKYGFKYENIYYFDKGNPDFIIFLIHHIIIMLTKEQLDEITRQQKEKQNLFRAVPDSGKSLNIWEKNSWFTRTFFYLPMTAKPLVENYKINPGDYVLDVCTGSGVIAIFSAYKGAKGL